MHVSAIFDNEYDGDASGAVWLVDSFQNRKWFEQQTDLDPWSALFFVENYETREKALYYMICGIQEHYPDWETISVIGIELNDSIRKDLNHDGRIEDAKDRFSLHKN